MVVAATMASLRTGAARGPRDLMSKTAKYLLKLSAPEAPVDDVDGVLEEDLGDLDAGAPYERLFGPRWPHFP